MADPVDELIQNQYGKSNIQRSRTGPSSPVDDFIHQAYGRSQVDVSSEAVGPKGSADDLIQSLYGVPVTKSEMQSTAGDLISSTYGKVVSPTTLENAKRQVASAEGAAQDLGILDAAKRKVGSVLVPVLDVLSRTNYAAAGAVQELFGSESDKNIGGVVPTKGDVLRAIERAGSELFSGVGTVKGKKVTFDEAFQDMGWKNTHSLSDAVHGLYSETGNEWLKFKKGGFFDPTVRGTVAFGANVITDPITFITGGTEGAVKAAVQAGGKDIARVALTKAGEKALVEGIEKTATTKGVKGLVQVLGLTGDGIEQFRKSLYGALPNVNGAFKLAEASPAVKDAFTSAFHGLTARERQLIPGDAFANLAKAARVDSAVPFGILDSASEAAKQFAEKNGTKVLEQTQTGLKAAINASRKEAEQNIGALWLTDPKTYAHLFDDGGYKFMGYEIPGGKAAASAWSHLSVDAQVKLQRAFEGAAEKSRLVDWGVRSTKTAAAGASAALRIFQRDKTTDPIALMAKQRLIDENANLIGGLGSTLQKSIGDVKLNPKEWNSVTNIMDQESRRNSLGLLDNVDKATGQLLKPMPEFGQVARKQAFDSLAERAARTSTTDVVAPLVADEAYIKSVAKRIASEVPRLAGDATAPLEESMAYKLANYSIRTIRDLDLKEVEGWRTDLVDLAKAAPEPQSTQSVIAAINGVEQAAVTYLQKLKAAGNLNILKQPDALADEIMNKLKNGIPTGNPAEPMLKMTPELKDGFRNYLGEYITRNYVGNIPIYFTNRSGKITSGLQAIADRYGIHFTEDSLLGKFRAFYSSTSRPELEQMAKDLRKADPSFTFFRPVHDLREIMRRRIDLHAQDDFYRKWRRFITDTFDKDVRTSDMGLIDTLDKRLVSQDLVLKGDKPPSGLALSIFRDLTDGPDGLAPALQKKLMAEHDMWLVTRGQVDAQIAKGARGKVDTIAKGGRVVPVETFHPPANFAKLSQVEKKYWLGLELMNSGTRAELRTTMLRYADEIAADSSILPKFRNRAALNMHDLTTTRRLEMGGTVGKFTADVPIDIFDDFTAYRKNLIDSKEAGTLLQTYDNLSNFFKTWVTTMFPSFHFRNYYGNVALGFTEAGLGALNPADNATAAMMVARAFLGGRGAKKLEDLPAWRQAAVKKLDDIMGQKIIKTRLGQGYSANDIWELGRQHGVWTDEIKLFELSGEYSPYAEGVLKQKYRNLEHVARSPGEAIENQARLMLFIRELRRGHTPEAAAARVKEFLFDYSNLSTEERGFFRRTIPFYVFFRRNIPLQVKTLFRDPGKIATQIKLLNESQAENDRLATWNVEGTYMKLNRDGRELQMLNGVDLPAFQLRFLDAFLGNKQRQRDLLAMINPTLRAIPEYVTNTSFYSGQPLTRAKANALGSILDSRSVPLAVKDFVGWHKTYNEYNGKVEYTMNGRRMYFLMQAWAFSRILRTSENTFNAITQSSDTSFLKYLNNSIFNQQFLTGTQDQNINLDSEDYKKLIMRKKLVDDELQRRGYKKAGDENKTEY